MLTGRWPLALGTLAGLAAVTLAFYAGTTATEQWQLAARWTARAGFPILILTYSASSLLRLFPGETTKALVRDRRWWGLGFASCHTIHLVALTVFLTGFGEPRPLPVLIGGGTAYALMYAMVLTSNDAAHRKLGRNWKRLHTVGIHVLWFVFAFSYFGRVMEGVEMPYAAVALGVALLALLMRIIAWANARARRKTTV